MTLASRMAEAAGVSLPILAETLATYAEALERGWGDEDFSAVTHVVEQRIGRKLSE